MVLARSDICCGILSICPAMVRSMFWRVGTGSRLRFMRPASKKGSPSPVPQAPSAPAFQGLAGRSATAYQGKGRRPILFKMLSWREKGEALSARLLCLDVAVWATARACLQQQSLERGPFTCSTTNAGRLQAGGRISFDLWISEEIPHL